MLPLCHQMVPTLQFVFPPSTTRSSFFFPFLHIHLGIISALGICFSLSALRSDLRLGPWLFSYFLSQLYCIWTILYLSKVTLEWRSSSHRALMFFVNFLNFTGVPVRHKVLSTFTMGGITRQQKGGVIWTPKDSAVNYFILGLFPLASQQT